MRDWLLSLQRDERRTIGADLKSLQFDWPVGLPLVRKLDANLWELRTRVSRRAVRVLFTQVGQDLVLLHAFFKQSQRTPREDLQLGVVRLREVHHG